ncbi:MAG: translation initiation factor IF-3 [Candidatus Dasytiphilus stammeri]
MKVGKSLHPIRHNRINTEIRVPEVRLTGLDGESIGIVSINEALEQAEQAGVDLVEISPNAVPPVCRMIDYGKFIYEKTKISKEQKKKQKNIQVKEIKFRPVTEESDYHVKLRSLIRFLQQGDKVKISLRFKGREMTHQQLGLKVFKRIERDVKEIAVVEFFPTKLEGRQMIMILSSKKKISK